MLLLGGPVTGPVGHSVPTCAAASSLGWALRLPGTFFPWGRDTAAGRWGGGRRGRAWERQHLSHTAARQTDVATDGCATPYSHHTRTRALPPHYEPHTGTPGAATASGVWANPILGEADMTADNEENRATKADPEKRCLCWWEKPQVLLRLPWLNPGTGETVLVFPGPRSLQPRAQPSQPHWQPHEACGGKNVGSLGLQVQPGPAGRPRTRL